MTDDINALAPAELSIAVAVEVMGWRSMGFGGLMKEWVDADEFKVFGSTDLSGSWAGAGRVIERMAELGFDYQTRGFDLANPEIAAHHAEFKNERLRKRFKKPFITADTAPLAIARAALCAVRAARKEEA